MTLSVCAACREPIQDQWIYEVLDGLWHGHCVRCVDCGQPLTDKCFTRNGKLYCREDFYRRYWVRHCSGCFQEISQGEYYLNAWDQVYHYDCYKCCLCLRKVNTGEEIHLTQDNRFICKEDFTARMKSKDEIDNDKENSSSKSEQNPPTHSNLTSPECVKEGDDADTIMSECSFDDQLSSTNKNISSTCSLSSHEKKTNRDSTDTNAICNGPKKRGPRTTIKTKQLEQLKSAFAATPKPTRHTREELARDTGLAMRVIQVWFQNRRSKERRIKQSITCGGPRRHYYRRLTSTRPFDDNEILSHPSLNYLPEGFQADFMYQEAQSQSYNDFLMQQELHQRLTYGGPPRDVAFAMHHELNSAPSAESSGIDSDDVQQRFHNSSSSSTTSPATTGRRAFGDQSWD